MTFVQSIFRYVLVACIAMVLYCVYNVCRVDVPCVGTDINEYLVLQLMFTAGAISSYLIIKHED